jgi:hypothetical protein
MTMREALEFLDELTKHMERSIAASDARYSNLKVMPKWSRPTRDQVTESLRANRAAFPRDRDATHSFTRNLAIALQRHWIAKGPCQPHCHASHLWLTDMGAQALQMMKDHGCETGDHVQPLAPVLRFERKVRVA